MSLEGKIALVTGSGRNIGRCIALKLASAGADLYIHDLPDSEGALETAEDVRKLGRRAWVLGADLRHTDKIRTMFHEIKDTTGRLDILVNNAAMGAARGAMRISPSNWDLTLETSARSVVFCSQHAAKLMTSGWGRIINISSLGSRRYIPDYIAIGASKSVVENVTRAFAVELAPKGIHVNCVCGGMIDTSTLQHLGPSIQAQKEDYEKRCPMKRLGRPEDLAKVVAFLCSEDADWIVGQTIVADGGFSLL